MAYFDYDDRYGCRVSSPDETNTKGDTKVSPEAAAANAAQWAKAAPAPKETAVQGSLGSLLAGAARRRK